MSAARHTPGPWLYEAGVEDFEGEHYVCHPKTVCDVTTVCNLKTKEDAHLIAAAPDLLRALKLAVAQLESHGLDGLASGADAAIAKAEGRS